MKFPHVLLMLFSVCFWISCTSDPKQSLASTANTPEAVARSWQYYMDVNQFDKAKELSSPRTVSFIEALEQLVWSDTEPPLSDTTIFESMQCVESGDSAICRFTFNLEGELLADSFKLLKINGRWLLDIQEDPLAPDDSDMEEMLDFLNQE